MDPSRRFGDYELRYRSEDMGERKPRNLIEAFHDDKLVGFLNWRATSGIVEFIKVDGEHRRRGVATAMWDFAQSLPRIHPRRRGLGQSAEGSSSRRSVSF